jgi:hypothetical protein
MTLSGTSDLGIAYSLDGGRAWAPLLTPTFFNASTNLAYSSLVASTNGWLAVMGANSASQQTLSMSLLFIDSALCTCAPDLDGSVCGGNGTCAFGGASGTSGCVCHAGIGGALCDQCAVGYFGPTCQPCPGVTDSHLICYGNGVCNGSGTFGGDGNCTCFSDTLNGQTVNAACGVPPQPSGSSGYVLALEIAVGPLALLALGLLAWYACWRRKRVTHEITSDAYNELEMA